MAARVRRTSGFTLVELLVVIAIIGTLVGLIMPAIASVRESGRRATCVNNLKELGTASTNHVTSQGHYPSSGWGGRWTGDPNRGFREKQPGGWAFNLLPYLEEQNIHDIGKVNRAGAVANRTELARQRGSVLAVLICPSRRRPIGYPGGSNCVNASQPTNLAKTDYAANGGSVVLQGPGPETSCLNQYPNCSWSTPDDRLRRDFSGISGERSRITPEHVDDGDSNTYLIGEKYLNPRHYASGRSPGDLNSAYQGNDGSNNRWTARGMEPRRDTPMVDDARRFGSAHNSGFHVVMCDFSVQQVNYNIHSDAHMRLGNRRDGQPPDKSAFRQP